MNDDTASSLPSMFLKYLCSSKCRWITSISVLIKADKCLHKLSLIWNLVVLYGNAPYSYAHLAINWDINPAAFFKLQDHIDRLGTLFLSNFISSFRIYPNGSLWHFTSINKLEPVDGTAPSSQLYQSRVLLLYYTGNVSAWLLTNASRIGRAILFRPTKYLRRDCRETTTANC